MNVRQLALARQKNQYVGRVDNPVTVLSSMLAIQAQDYLGGLWAIGARTRCSEREVEQLLNDRKIVRSWPMRGTLHFVAAEDLRWLQQLLAPRVLAAGASRQRELGLDGRVLVKSESALIRVLEGGCALTREEMTAALERAKVSTEGQRGYHILVRLAMQGLLCFGPRKGKSQTFVLLDEWIPRGSPSNLIVRIRSRCSHVDTLRGMALRPSAISRGGPAFRQETLEKPSRWRMPILRRS